MRQCACRCNSRCVWGDVPWPRLRLGPPRVGKQLRRRFGRSLRAGCAIHRDIFGQPQNICGNRPNMLGRSSRCICANGFDFFAPPPQQACANRPNIFGRSLHSICANGFEILAPPPQAVCGNRPIILARPSPAILANRRKSASPSPPLWRSRPASSALSRQARCCDHRRPRQSGTRHDCNQSSPG